LETSILSVELRGLVGQPFSIAEPLRKGNEGFTPKRSIRGAYFLRRRRPGDEELVDALALHRDDLEPEGLAIDLFPLLGNMTQVVKDESADGLEAVPRLVVPGKFDADLTGRFLEVKLGVDQPAAVLPPDDLGIVLAHAPLQEVSRRWPRRRPSA